MVNWSKNYCCFARPPIVFSLRFYLSEWFLYFVTVAIEWAMRTSFCIFVVKGPSSQEIKWWWITCTLCDYPEILVSRLKDHSNHTAGLWKCWGQITFKYLPMAFLFLRTVLACVYVVVNLKTQIGISKTSLQSSTLLPTHNLNTINVSNYDLDWRKSAVLSERLSVTWTSESLLKQNWKMRQP